MDFVDQQDRGSSMLGMLIVILIIGVVIWFSWGGGSGTDGTSPRQTIERGKEARIKAELNTLRKALSQYRAVNGQYPPDLETLAEEGMAPKQAIRGPGGEQYKYDHATGTVKAPGNGTN